MVRRYTTHLRSYIKQNFGRPWILTNMKEGISIKQKDTISKNNHMYSNVQRHEFDNAINSHNQQIADLDVQMKYLYIK